MQSINLNNVRAIFKAAGILILIFLLVGCSSDNMGNKNGNDTGLTQGIIDLYSNLEDKIDSPEFQNYETIEEMEATIVSWLTIQKEVKSFSVKDHVITIDFGNGIDSRIEIVDEIETNNENEEPKIDEEFGFETVDACCFNDEQQQNVLSFHQENVQLETRAISPDGYKPDYLFAVLWEPYSNNGISDLSAIEPYYKKGSNESIATCLPRFPNSNTLRKYQDIQCEPKSFKAAITETINGHYPNIVMIASHGANADYIVIGCFEHADEDFQDACWENDKLVFRIIKPKKPNDVISKGRYRYYLECNAANLKERIGTDVNLTNTIVLLNTCESYIPMKSNPLAKLFYDDWKAASVIGWGKKVENNSATKAAAVLLKTLLIPYNLNDAYANNRETFAISVAVNDAISQTNNPNISYRGSGSYKFKHQPVNTCKKANSKTRIQGVAMPGAHINFYEASYSSATYCGIVYSSATNDPKIDDGKSKFEYTSLNHTVYDGEDFYFAVHGLTPGKQYYYRAFVCSIYDGVGYPYYADEVGTFIADENPDDPAGPKDEAEEVLFEDGILTVSKKQLEFDHDFGSEYITVSSTVGVDGISIDESEETCDWASVKIEESEISSEDLKQYNANVSVQANPSEDTRATSVRVFYTVDGKKKFQRISISQNYKSYTFTSYPDPVMHESYSAGTKTFTVTTDAQIIDARSDDPLICETPVLISQRSLGTETEYTYSVTFKNNVEMINRITSITCYIEVGDKIYQEAVMAVQKNAPQIADFQLNLIINEVVYYGGPESVNNQCNAKLTLYEDGLASLAGFPVTEVDRMYWSGISTGWPNYFPGFSVGWGNGSSFGHVNYTYWNECEFTGMTIYFFMDISKALKGETTTGTFTLDRIGFWGNDPGYRGSVIVTKSE